jgi:hypothetical protein
MQQTNERTDAPIIICVNARSAKGPGHPGRHFDPLFHCMTATIGGSDSEADRPCRQEEKGLTIAFSSCTPGSL